MLSRYPASPTPPFDEVNLSTAGSTGESTLRYTGIEPLCSLSGLEAVAVAIRLNSSLAVTLNTCRGSLMGSCQRTWQTSFTLSSARARVAGWVIAVGLVTLSSSPLCITRCAQKHPLDWDQPSLHWSTYHAHTFPLSVNLSIV